MADFKHYYKTRTNNLERRYNGKTFNIGNTTATADSIRGGGDTLLQPGDVLAVGTIPGGSLVLDMAVLVKEAFVGTTPLFDFYYTSDFPEGNMVTIATGVDVSATNANKTIIIDLPTSGVVNGKALWVGDTDKHGDYYIVAVYDGADAPTAGEINVVMGYDRFGTNEGAY